MNMILSRSIPAGAGDDLGTSFAPGYGSLPVARIFCA
jgi:hypothetical protein